MFDRKILTTLPEKNGCYLYFNNDNKIIYVGKAKNIKKRVTNYFTKPKNFKTTNLVNEIDYLETIVVSNEKEALLLEQNLIKQHKPKYNIVLNDDKKYPYIVVTNEKDPEYKYVRNYNSKYKLNFGPFPDGSKAYSIIKILKRVYPLRNCKGNLGKPCLYYQINQCSGACFKDVLPSYYEKMYKKIENFFSAENEELQNILIEKIQKAIELMQFEEAERIKNDLKHIDLAIKKQEVDLDEKVNLDIVNYSILDAKICFVVLFYRGGRMINIDYNIFDYNEEEIEDLFRTFLIQLYSKNDNKYKIFTINNIDLDDLGEIYKIEYDKKHQKLLDIAKINAEEYLKNQKLRKDIYIENENETLIELQKLVGLEKVPYHIEVYDVANLYEEHVTGGMVVFKGAKVAKNEFRKYNLTKTQNSDSGRMAEMLKRRYNPETLDYFNLPDLIIADGALQQVKAIKEVLSNYDLSIPVIGLVKNDKHKTEKILGLNYEEIQLVKNSKLYKMLSSFQDRVHDFTISAFRKKLNKVK